MSELSTPPSLRPAATRVAVMCPDAAVDAGYVAAALARRLAQAAEERGNERVASVVLVDGQPGTGGLDVLLDLETAPGARWPAMRGAGLEIDADKLLRALPSRDGVAVLSHARMAALVDEPVQLATCGALAGIASALVMTAMPPSVPSPLTADALVLVVRGSVASMAAAEAVVSALDGDLPCGVLALEADTRTRLAITDALASPLVAAAPARWCLGSRCAADVLAGRWPGHGDRVMGTLLDGLAGFVETLEGSLAWV